MVSAWRDCNGNTFKKYMSVKDFKIAGKVIEKANVILSFYDYIKTHHDRLDGDGRWAGLTNEEKNKLAFEEGKKFETYLTEEFEAYIKEE